jgi:hypothetical protein
MFSPLSGGTKRAAQFDQAARNVACIAELLHRAKRAPRTMDRLGFVVLAPAQQINAGVFGRLCEKDSIAGDYHTPSLPRAIEPFRVHGSALSLLHHLVCFCVPLREVFVNYKHVAVAACLSLLGACGGDSTSPTDITNGTVSAASHSIIPEAAGARSTRPAPFPRRRYPRCRSRMRACGRWGTRRRRTAVPTSSRTSRRAATFLMSRLSP